MNRLVVNGCSYMNAYTGGKGHIDLATKLKISTAVDLSQSGCSNNRIIRTTLKDSFLSAEKTLYILGITFIVRNEIPILKLRPDENELTSFEGRWTNPQNQMYSYRWEDFWTEKDTDTYVDLMNKESLYGVIDKTEHLMYQLVSLIDSLVFRGHRIIIYQQADQCYFQYLNSDKLKLFSEYKNFINGFNWTAVQWQHSQGVPEQTNPTNYKSKYGTTPAEMRHRKSGEHHKLNEFLTKYIKDNKILE